MLPPSPTSTTATPSRSRARHSYGGAALLGVVLALVLASCGADDTDRADAPGTTEPSTPTTAAPPTPPTTPPTLPPGQRYETITTVIDDGTGARACFVVLDSLPPQCGSGVDLAGWSWDSIDAERVDGPTTWIDQVYLSGTYDVSTATLAVDDTRLPTDDDRGRILLSRPLPDHSIPCPPPADGWPARNQEWPGEQVAAIDGYAGAWTMEPGQVMVVKFTGDLEAAERAVRQVYGDAICVVGATHSERELAAIQEQLQELSSIQVLTSAIYVDATGEWVEAEIVAPDPARQAALDAEYGDGVVRLRSLLRPIDG